MQELATADVVGEAVPASARGVVHSVYRHACNLETGAGPLLTLLASAQGNLPRGIRLARPTAPFAARIMPGQPVLIAKRVLKIPDALVTVDFSDAALFRGTIVVRATAEQAAQSASALTALRVTVCEHVPQQGFAPLLLCAPVFLSGLEQALAVRLGRALPQLARATAQREFDGVIQAAQQLLGLGPGLTPSGDDFLVGYLAALWSRRREEGMEALLEALPARLGNLLHCANAVSRQMLGDAMLGRFPELLVDVAHSLQGTGDVVACARRALAIGNCSGADLLCGLLFGHGPQWVTPSGPSLARAARMHAGPNAPGDGIGSAASG